MIVLEIESQIVRSILERGIFTDEKLSETYECCDFDGVRIKISHPPSTKKHDKKKEKSPEEEAEEEKRLKTFVIQVFIECTSAIADYGAAAQFDAVYGKYKIAPEAGFTHAIQVPFKELAEAEQKEWITLASRMKSNILGAPFLWVAERFAKKEAFAPFIIPYRSSTNENIYVVPSENGAVAIFTIKFSDPGDQVIGGVFFNELQAARTRVPSAPAVTFYDSAPGELSSFTLPDALKVKKGNYAFVAISLLAPQLSDRKKQDVAYYVPMFRDYLHYHIKCSKAFLHLKMRSQTNELLKVLDEAKPEPKKVRRTVTGK